LDRLTGVGRRRVYAKSTTISAKGIMDTMKHTGEYSVHQVSMRDFNLVPLKEITVADTPFQAPATPQHTSVTLDIDPDLGLMKMDNINNRYFSIGDTLMKFKENVMVVPSNRHTHFGLAMMGSYKGTVQFDGGEWVEVNQGESYFTFNPGVEELHRFGSEQPMKVHFLEIKHEYLTDMLVEQETLKGSALDNFRQRVLNNKFAGSHTKFNSPTTQGIINSMFNCPLEGTLGNMMLEGSLQQLLALQFSLMGSDIQTSQSITRRDRDVMNAVKDHLDDTFMEDHSLPDLARKFGINQNKLKTQFRELFGVPVISYIFNLKMEHARMLLYDRGMFVSEVSSVVGYRNSNHFATAFKRKFGVNPSRLKA
jgi:AraC-like DNA-binding protein